MAITRCPYCHAIIDEADKYCNNCGTQLLFSEDEEVEEEIPGEKIVDADVEEKDYTVDEPESEKKHRPGAAKDLDAEIGEELEEKLPKGTGKTAIEDLMAGEDLEDEEPEEVILVDEIEESEDEEAGEEELAGELAADLEGEIEEGPVKDVGAPVQPAEDRTPLEPPPCSPEEPVEPEPEVEYVAASGVPDEAATAGEASLRPATFDSQELEHLGRTVELGREKIDKFIEVMAARNAETGPVAAEPELAAEAEPEPAAAVEAEPAAVAAPEPGPGAETEAEPEPEEAVEPAPPRVPETSTGTLPPWASTMKGAPVFPEETGSLAAPAVRGGREASDTDEVEIFPRRRGVDSTIGLPEKVDQAPLPFGRSAVEAGAEGEEEPLEEIEAAQIEEETAGEEGTEESEAPEAGPASESAAGLSPREPVFPARGEEEAGKLARAEILPADEIEEPAARPPFNFAVFFKSRAFDLLFVGLFWLVALWLAAASMDVTLFDILGAMSGSMILLYAVFVLLYFFLFKFFLGETLGDRLFRAREGD